MLLLPLRARGFTLVELLVVISIIAILMGLLIPAISLIKERAKQAKARTQLAQVEAALKIYKDVNGFYPELSMTANAQANATLLRTALATVDREHYAAADSLKDPWKNDLRYRPAKSLAFTAGSPLLLDSDNPPGGDSYQLWSIGQNGRDDAALIPTADPKKVGDDLVTWK